MSHGVIDIVDFVYAYFFGLHYVLPELLVEVDLTVHRLAVRTIFNDDGLRSLFMVAAVNRLRKFRTLKFEILHVRLNFPYLQQFLLVLYLVPYSFTATRNSAL